MDRFKSQLADHPCRPGFNTSLSGDDCINGGHYVDVLDAAEKHQVKLIYQMSYTKLRICKKL